MNNITNNIYKVGDILYMSWGYDQTNIDFFRVKELKGKQTVVLQPVVLKRVSEDYYTDMSGDFAFDPNNYQISKLTTFIDDPEAGKAFRVRNGGAGAGIYIHHHLLAKYNGQKLYESWYA